MTGGTPGEIISFSPLFRTKKYRCSKGIEQKGRIICQFMRRVCCIVEHPALFFCFSFENIIMFLGDNEKYQSLIIGNSYGNRFSYSYLVPFRDSFFFH
jgi:hypothetical protein